MYTNVYLGMWPFRRRKGNVSEILRIIDYIGGFLDLWILAIHQRVLLVVKNFSLTTVLDNSVMGAHRERECEIKTRAPEAALALCERWKHEEAVEGGRFFQRAARRVLGRPPGFFDDAGGGNARGAHACAVTATLASLKRSSTSCSSRALHRPPEAFLAVRGTYLQYLRSTEGSPTGAPTGCACNVTSKERPCLQRFERGRQYSLVTWELVGKSSAQPDVFSSNTSSSRTVTHASTPTASPTTWNTPNLNATQRLDRNTSAEKGVPTRCRQRRKGSHINSDMSSLASGTSARGFRSGTSSFGKPTISKNLRALSHNDFTYLGEEAPRPLAEHQESHRELLSLLSAILCCRRKQCTTPQI